MNYLTKEQMEKLPTKRLLAYKRKHLHEGKRIKCSTFCFDSMSPFYSYENCKNCPNFEDEFLKFEKAYENIKEVLSTREHVERRSK